MTSENELFNIKTPPRTRKTYFVEEDVIKFLTFINTGYSEKMNYFVEVRLISKNGKIIQKFFTRGEIQQIVSFIKNGVVNGFDCYVSLLPRTKKEGTSKSVDVGNTFFIDLDSEEARKRWEEIYNKLVDINLRPSLLTLSGRGIHLFWKVEDLVEKEKWKEIQSRLISYLKNKLPEFGVDEKVKDPARIVRIPGTLNFKYDIPKETKILRDDFIIYTLREFEAKLPPEKRKEPYKKVSTVKTIEEKPKKLTSDQIEKLVELFLPIWKPGVRDKLTFSLCGWLIKNNVDRESIYKLIDEITTRASDEQKKLRLYLVDYHFDRRIIPEAKETIERLKGISGIEEVLLEIFGEDSYNEVNEFLEKIKQVTFLKSIYIFSLTKEEFRTKREKIGKKIITTRYKVLRAYLNVPKRGIIFARFNVENGIWSLTSREYIAEFWINDCLVIVNPINKEETYKLKIKWTTGKEKTIEGNLNEVVNELSEEKGVKSSSKIKDALKSILMSFEKNRISRIKIGFEATGFFQFKDKLVWYKSPLLDLKLKEKATIEDLRKGLLTLNEFAKFYRAEKFLPIIATGIISTLGYVRKQNNLVNKIVVLNGYPGTGKTTLVRLVQHVWGIFQRSPPFELTGSSLKSEYRFGEYLSKGTLPIGCHESYSVLIQQNLSELLKNLATEEILRAWPHQNKKFYGYGKLYLTFNYQIPKETDPGLLERRLLVVTFSKSDEPNEEKKEEFQKFYSHNKHKLSLIGSFLIDWYRENWNEIKDVILDEDEIEIGRKILKDLYLLAGLEIPKWLETKVELEEIKTDFSTDLYVFITIRDDLVEMANKYRFVENGTFTESSAYYRQLIEFLKERGGLPFYLHTSKDIGQIYIRPSVLDKVKKKFGIEISGGLKSLAERLGYKYEPRKISGIKKSQKVMVIPFENFIKLITQDIDEEDSEGNDQNE